MGAGIFLIVVGVLVGGATAASPSRMWWATQSWKFKNPEANEPSDTSYGMTRAGGVLFTVFALIFGSVLISGEISDKRQREAQEQQRAAEKAFVAPPPEKRGPLPVIGYVAEKFPNGLAVTVYYVAPKAAVREAVRESASRGASKWNYPCYTSAWRDPAVHTRKLVNPELTWAPKELGDISKSDQCRPGIGYKVHSASLYGVAATAVIVTDSAVVEKDGTVILPAASGNVVPRLAAELYPDP